VVVGRKELIVGYTVAIYFVFGVEKMRTSERGRNGFPRNPSQVAEIFLFSEWYRGIGVIAARSCASISANSENGMKLT
jgi:hypothetical protein